MLTDIAARQPVPWRVALFGKPGMWVLMYVYNRIFDLPGQSSHV